MINKIFNQDCLQTIERMDDELLDMVITSPPYNVNLGKNKFHKNPYDMYRDNKQHNEYIE